MSERLKIYPLAKAARITGFVGVILATCVEVKKQITVADVEGCTAFSSVASPYDSVCTEEDNYTKKDKQGRQVVAVCHTDRNEFTAYHCPSPRLNDKNANLLNSTFGYSRRSK